jgi:hypothetical protein
MSKKNSKNSYIFIILVFFLYLGVLQNFISVLQAQKGWEPLSQSIYETTKET